MAKKKKRKNKNLRQQIEENRWNICLYGAKCGEIKEKERQQNDDKKQERTEGARDTLRETDTWRRGDKTTPKEREPQGACADRASILPSSRYLLRTYIAKLCIYLVNQVEQVTEFRG